MRYFYITLGIFLVLLVYIFVPPLDFPNGAMLEVPEGSGLKEISQGLKEEGVIRSPFWFRTFAIIFGGERNMKAGEYYFPREENPLQIAWRIYRGDYGVEIVRITVPEGHTVKEISKLFGERFENFDNQIFEESAPQGYLFPDTYFVPVTATPEYVVKLMKNNFDRQIFSLSPQVSLSGKNLNEIITMASILEAELLHREDREIASGILWKRIKIDMPLQVDAYQKSYKEKGLPEEPINNPGIVSIESAINPASTDYLYFLTGKDGKAHYAETYDEHMANIDKYLR